MCERYALVNVITSCENVTKPCKRLHPLRTLHSAHYNIPLFSSTTNHIFINTRFDINWIIIYISWVSYMKRISRFSYSGRFHKLVLLFDQITFAQTSKNSYVITTLQILRVHSKFFQITGNAYNIQKYIKHLNTNLY